MSEKSIVRFGPSRGFSISEILDEDGNTLRWEVTGMGGRVIATCASFSEASTEFNKLVGKVRDGFLPPGGGEAQKQEDPDEPSDPEDAFRQS